MNLAALVLQMCTCLPTHGQVPVSNLCVQACQTQTETEGNSSLKASLEAERKRIWQAIDSLSHGDAWNNLTLLQYTEPRVPGSSELWSDWEPSPGSLDAVMRTLTQRFLGIEDTADTLTMTEYWEWIDALVHARLLKRAYNIIGYYGW